MLAVQVDYSTASAIIGTEKSLPIPRHQILEALKGIGYSGTFVEEPRPNVSDVSP